MKAFLETATCSIGISKAKGTPYVKVFPNDKNNQFLIFTFDKNIDIQSLSWIDEYIQDWKKKFVAEMIEFNINVMYDKNTRQSHTFYNIKKLILSEKKDKKIDNSQELVDFINEINNESK